VPKPQWLFCQNTWSCAWVGDPCWTTLVADRSPSLARRESGGASGAVHKREHYGRCSLVRIGRVLSPAKSDGGRPEAHGRCTPMP
jgi:hypothetical protein